MSGLKPFLSKEVLPRATRHSCLHQTETPAVLLVAKHGLFWHRRPLSQCPGLDVCYLVLEGFVEGYGLNQQWLSCQLSQLGEVVVGSSTNPRFLSEGPPKRCTFGFSNQQQGKRFAKPRRGGLAA